VSLGGLAYALFVLVHPVSGLSDPHVIHSGQWLVAHTLHLLRVVLVLLGARPDARRAAELAAALAQPAAR
jgi:hypothetical protein